MAEVRIPHNDFINFNAEIAAKYNLKKGDILIDDKSVFSDNSNTQPSTDTSDAKNTTLTQAKYEENQPEEVKNLKIFIKDKEGKESATYVAVEGNATIGYGHVLKSQPKFIEEIAESTTDKKERDKLLKKALDDDNNKKILKDAIEADLQAAAKLTGIGNISIDVKDNLKLSDAQIELLLNADLKEKQNEMEKRIGKDILAQRTTAQKQVALDLFYNVGGGKIPKFIENFKNGNMEKAQEEIDIFTANKVYYAGLIKRCYERMLLINDNKLTDTSKTKLLDAYNKYLAQKGKPAIKNFDELEPLLKK